MISIIITAYKEADSVRKALMRYIDQLKVYQLKQPHLSDVHAPAKTNVRGTAEHDLSKEECVTEIIVVAPDKETEKVCSEFRDISGTYSVKIRYLKDTGVGKPAALNIAFKEAKGDILILTDGDVYPSYYVVRRLVGPFKNKKIGAVTGRPISVNLRTTVLGYWSHLLTDMAHETRMRCQKERKSMVASGYLYAVRRSALPQPFNMPEDILSDDAYISYILENRGYKVYYEPTAHVMVKFPTNFKDWIAQKSRSTGGYEQLKKMNLEPQGAMRGFKQEISGLLEIFKYPKNIKEFWKTCLLCFARGYLWLKIWYERRLKEKSFSETWVRINSTKDINENDKANKANKMIK